MSLACGSAFTLFCTSRGRVFACGSNSHGQLGFAHDEYADTDPIAQQPTLVNALAGTRVVGAAAGFSHALFLSRPGGVLSCGAGECGQCGHGDEQATYSVSVVSALASVPCLALAAGNYHSVALAKDDGGVYAWGEGAFGRLGHGATERELVPRLVHGLLGVPIVHIACGGACTAAVDSAGDLWTWGSGTWGQLAQSEGADELAPRQVEALQGRRVRHVTCAEDHMCALVEHDGARLHLYAWGRTCNGRLGSAPPVDAPPTRALMETAATLASMERRDKAASGRARVAPGLLLRRVRIPHKESREEAAAAPQAGDGASGEQAPSLAECGISMVCCGGAHTIVLYHSDRMEASAAPGSQSKRRHAADPARSVLEAHGADGRHGAQAVGGQLHAVAGESCAVQVSLRDSAGSLCSLGRRQRLSAVLMGQNGQVVAQPSLADSGGGVFSADIEITRAGAYELHVMLHRTATKDVEVPTPGMERAGERDAEGAGKTGRMDAQMAAASPMTDAGEGVHVCGSPAPFVVAPAEVSPSHSQLAGELIASGCMVAGKASTVLITTRDRFGNACADAAAGSGTALPIPIEALLCPTAPHRGDGSVGFGAGAIAGHVGRLGNGAYQARMVAHSSGRYALFCRTRGEAVGDSPLIVDVLPDAASPSACVIHGLDPDQRHPVGARIELRIQAADAHGNARPAGADHFVMQVSGPTRGLVMDVESIDGGVYLCSGIVRASGMYYIAPLLDGSHRLPRTPVRLFATDVGGEASSEASGGASGGLSGQASGDVADGSCDRSERAVTPGDEQPDDVRDAINVLRGSQLEFSADSPRTGVEGEPARFKVTVSPCIGSPCADAVVACRLSDLPRSAVDAALRCGYDGTDEGEARLVSVASDGRTLHYECTPQSAGGIRLHVALRLAQSPSRASRYACSWAAVQMPFCGHDVRVFPAMPWVHMRSPLPSLAVLIAIPAS